MKIIYKKIIRKVTVILFACCLVGCALIFYCNNKVGNYAHLVVDSSMDLPNSRVAVVFGCSKMVYGRPNQFYLARINAAFDLYNTGKVQKLIVSGDNSRKTYDEPTDMKEDLMALGIPESDIICDYAGFRTLDTVIRAQKVFGQSNFIAVTQRFQCERAIYIGAQHGINITGYPADDIKGIISKKTYFREYLARVRAWIDVDIIGSEPKFLGPKIDI